MSFPAFTQRLRTHPAAACLLAMATLSPTCIAQQNSPPHEDPTFTLHVYTNLIQIPVLVLGPFLDYVPKVDSKNISVSVDGGKPFHPTHIRPEGDDPIALAVLLDLSDTDGDLLPAAADALAKMATRSLQPHDQVALYAMDCTLVRVAHFAAPNAHTLRQATKRAIDTFKHDRQHHRTCGDADYLLNMLATLTSELSQQPGRRVILAITGGRDTGSKFAVPDVHRLAVRNGVAIFGLTGTPHLLFMSLPDNRFSSLCEGTGGIARRVNVDILPKSLELFVKTVRDRIIVEFPRPPSATAGSHDIEVSLVKSSAFVRPAGISVPIADPKVLADPNTIHPESPPPPDTSTNTAPPPPQ